MSNCCFHDLSGNYNKTGENRTLWVVTVLFAKSFWSVLSRCGYIGYKLYLIWSLYADVAQLVESHSDTVVVSGSSPLVSTRIPEVQGVRVE